MQVENCIGQVWIVFGWKKNSGQSPQIMRICETKEKAQKTIEEYKIIESLRGFDFTTDTYPVW